ncbi:MAG: iron-sulfur cluster assembly protein, partial [Candidatus Thiodiazotropha sp.]
MAAPAGKDVLCKPVSAGCIKAISVDGGKAKIEVTLGFPAAGYLEELKSQLKTVAEAVDGVSSAEVDVATNIVAHSAQKGVKHIKGVKNIIAVASGKGGVGK